VGEGAIGYVKLGQPDLAGQARTHALSEAKAAIDGFESEKPTPDDDGAKSAATLREAILSASFYDSAGCSP
jgi:hypothetical protein